MDGVLAKRFGVVENPDIRAGNERILVFRPRFNIAQLLAALCGTNDSQSSLEGTVTSTYQYERLWEVNAFRVLLTLRSLERVRIDSPKGGVFLHPDWRFYGTCQERDDPPYRVAGYVRTDRASGLPDLCLVVPVTSRQMLAMAWTPLMATVLRYVLEMSINAYARRIGASPRIVKKWEDACENDAHSSRLSASMRHRIDDIYVSVTKFERMQLEMIMSQAETTGASALQLARDQYPSAIIRSRRSVTPPCE